MQLRATWSVEKDTCILLNAETSKPNIISSLVTDIVLLLIMLKGLLRSRIGGGSAYGVGRILRNQVRWWQLLLAVILPYLLMRIFVRKGLIWLFLATVAEVPPTVRAVIFIHYSCSLIVVKRRRCSCVYI